MRQYIICVFEIGNDGIVFRKAQTQDLEKLILFDLGCF